MRQSLNRSQAADLGRQTAEIVHAGRYRAPSGQLVHIGHLVRTSVDATVEISPDHDLTPVPTGPHRTDIIVLNTDTLAAARPLVDQGLRPVALNFASAKNPGGGWLGGSRAQEESLARSSALVATLEGRHYYDVHREQADPIYTDHAIYSPGVPVFRDHGGALLEELWTVDFLTSAAVNAKALRERDRSRWGEIDPAMRGRIERVLHIAASHGHDAMVLGAWGCGAFRNDPAEMAERFKDALNGPFAGVFRTVAFAILDWSKERRFLGPFARAFGQPVR